MVFTRLAFWTGDFLSRTSCSEPNLLVSCPPLGEAQHAQTGNQRDTPSNFPSTDILIAYGASILANTESDSLDTQVFPSGPTWLT